MPQYSEMTFFLRLTVLCAKFGQTHDAVTNMAADNHVPQFHVGEWEARITLANNR